MAAGLLLQFSIGAVYAWSVFAKALKDAETANAHIAWSAARDGAYMQTPLVYGDALYVCKDNGVLSVFDVRTGQRHFQTRLADGRFDVRFRLWDVVRGQSLAAEGFVAAPGDLRLAAHRIADMIYEKLTGDRGVLMAFVGRGRQVRAPVALAGDPPATCKSGTVLDPIFSLTRRVRLARA